MLANLASVPFVFSMMHWVVHPVCYRCCKTVFKMVAGKSRVSKLFFTLFLLWSLATSRRGAPEGEKMASTCCVFASQVLHLQVWAQLMLSYCFPHTSDGWDHGNLSFSLSKPNCFPCAGTCSLASSLQPFIQLSPVTGMFWTNTDEGKYETPC